MSSQTKQQKQAPSADSSVGETHYRFAPTEYGDHLVGHAAAKLSDSAVAPLVAAARGYRRISDKEGVQQWCSYYRVPNNSSKRKALMQACVGTLDNGSERDGLEMPWHSLKEATLGEAHGEAAGWRTEIQLRPCEPIVVDPKKPKPQKYTWGSGTPMLLDIHPATPFDWTYAAPVILFAEGLLKGDAALSAYLAAHGAARELLAYTGDDAAEKMREFMQTIPVDSQVLILRAASATTFTKDGLALNSLEMGNRVAWLGFDADVETNRNVWRAASKVRSEISKQGAREVKLLSPVADGGGKDGVDDFLSHRGDWWTLADAPHLRDTFPALPTDDTDDLPADTWRITEDGASTERLIIDTDDSGVPSGKRWVPNDLKIGGRQTYRQERREPTRRELLRGETNFGQADPDEIEVGVEVAWRDGDEVESAEVVGPIEILGSLPAEWSKVRVGDRKTRIPADLWEHHSWPPRNKDGEKWLSAVQRTSGERAHLTEWMRMGWVPVEGHLPAFTVGETVIAASEEAAQEVRCGVDGNLLPGFEKFGIGGREGHRNLHWEDDAEAWAEQAHQDFSDLLQLYVTNGAWTDPAVSALVICAMFRPIVPVFEPVMNPRSTLYIYGPPGGGKSMTAKHILAAWAANGSDWQANLPGSADSTQAAMENATARSPIWAIDDLAPSVSAKKAENAEQAVSDIVRNTFNAQPKQRMNRDMTTKQSLDPRAQLIVTAENELSVDSAVQRLVPIFVRKGSLNPDTSVTEKIFRRNGEDGLASRCSAHLVLSVLWMARREGWEALTQRYTEAYFAEQEAVRNLLVSKGANPSKITRMSELIADLTIVLTLLKDADKAFGLGDQWLKHLREDPLAVAGREPRWGDEEFFRNHIAEMMITVHEKQADRTPGQAMLSAIRLLLSMKTCHIASAEDPSAPPYVTEQDSVDDDPSRTDAQVNSELGWNYLDDGKIAKSGQEIGKMVRPQRKRSFDEPIVLIDPKAAYNAAKNRFQEIIMSGSKEGSLFASMWDEGICPRSLESKRGDDAAENSVRLRVGGSARPRGVPIPLSVLLGDEPGSADSGDQDD